MITSQRFRRIVSIVILVLAVSAFAPSTARAEAGGLSHLELVIRTNTSGTYVKLHGLEVRTQRTHHTEGATLYTPPDGWYLRPEPSGEPYIGKPSYAVVDMVVEVGSANPTLTIEKGRFGETSVEIFHLNDGAPVPVFETVHDSHDEGLNVQYSQLSPTMLDAGGLAMPKRDDRRLTLAFYYPWWTSHSTSDRRIAPDRVTKPYDTTDPVQVGGMVDAAQWAGIDGFIVSWRGLADPHSSSVDLLVEQAASRPGFTIAPLIELPELYERRLLFGQQFSPAQAEAATREFLQRVPEPLQLRQDGRRVVFLFGMRGISTDQWYDYVRRVDDLDLFLVGDRLVDGMPVDGSYFYNPNSWSTAEIESAYRSSVVRSRLEPILDPAVPHLLWAATTSPGYDDRASSGLLGGWSRDRSGGQWYDTMWRTALDTDPDWVVITSWNEWYEQTHITPGTATGLRALHQTRSWTDGF